MTEAQVPFRRDRVTWGSYVMLALLTLQVTLIGPIMPFLRAEMELSYAEGALHTSVFAIGMMAAGFICGPIERKLGRKAAVALSALSLALGFSCIVLAPVPIMSILAAGFMGLIGSMIVVYVPLILSDVHGERRSQAFAESNLFSYLGALAAPLLVWAAASTGGWRGVGLVAWFIVIGSAIAFRGVSLRDSRSTSRASSARLGKAYWAYWTLLGLSVGIEFCFGVWSASFLEKVGGFARDNAVLGSIGFAVGMLSGRIAGTVLIRRVGEFRLALMSLCLTLIGFFIFWLSPMAWLTLLGLIVTGLGIANLYATVMTLALAAAPDAQNRAAARISMATGSAIIFTPLVLGALADNFGLFLGYLIVPLLIGASGFALWLGYRAR
ncbi:MAG: MFS transporter [Hyphomicrobiales bacterium]